MGFRVPVKTLNLTFSDEDYAGAEVKVKMGVTLRKVMEMSQSVDSDDPAQVVQSIKEFGDDFLISWNLEDDNDNPIPPNGESMIDLDSMFAFAMIKTWVEQVTGVNAPLDQRLSDGNTSAGQPTNLDPSSLDLESLSKPN